MPSHQELFEDLIAALSSSIGQELPIEDGICAIENQIGEVVINIELPESSEQLLLHRMLAPVPAQPDVREARALQLLSLNSHQMQMSGHWFCIDPDGQAIHLMTSRPIKDLEVGEFEKMAENFIAMGSDLSEILQGEEIELINSDAIPNEGIAP
ncbi:CesT family type III secretion system chaperone [Parendozoicomonas sp. Alg238-R29]|uniref:CesT family type III secretion system chaperone n=1 Tax=Parendozoicomonas sp. Alg238-R29 TaxID=2993446 RepID=UPI00248E4E0E|nr:CesT family type III secretion system chaperone [Parendozoicomonas sp. Alg238-R29]